MSSNRGVVYIKPGTVEVQSIDFPQLKNPQGRKIGHGVILKVISTNICGSDQHMVRGRTRSLDPHRMLKAAELPRSEFSDAPSDSIYAGNARW